MVWPVSHFSFLILLLSVACGGYAVPKASWSDFDGFTRTKPVFVETEEGVLHFTARSPLVLVQMDGKRIVAQYRSITVEKAHFVGRMRDGREVRVPLASIRSIEVDGKILGELGNPAEKKEPVRGVGPRGYGPSSF